MKPNPMAMAWQNQFKVMAFERRQFLRIIAYQRDPIKWAKERGSADAYYGRPMKPRVRVSPWMDSRPCENDAERAAYIMAYKNETERKEW